MSGINPKFLNVEKKVQYNIRLPQRLLDKYNSYAELTGNSTTNIITNVLSDFIADKVILKDYLDDIGGVTVKIPYAINQKNMFINDSWNLKDYNSTETLRYDVVDSVYTETYFAELFEVKKITNNLDIYVDDSFVANKKILKFNKNAIHSGIELYIYNLTEIIFADLDLTDEFDTFINCLYCLYFEVTANYDVDVYLIDYLTAINLLSASGNDDYKDLIIAAATELEKLNENVSNDIIKFGAYDESFSVEIKNYIFNVKHKVSDIADKYNSNNIIPFGSDIFSRLAIKDIKVAPDIDELIDEKIDAIFDEKFAELEKLTAEINEKIDNVNNVIESELNNTNK